MWRWKTSSAVPNHGYRHIPPGGGERKRGCAPVHRRRRSAPAVAKLVGRQVLVDVEKRRVWPGRQIDIEQSDDRLKALRVNNRPLPQRKGRSVEDECKMRRAPERGPILDLDRDRIALLGDAQDACVAGHVNVVGKQKLERRLADK